LKKTGYILWQYFFLFCKRLIQKRSTLFFLIPGGFSPRITVSPVLVFENLNLPKKSLPSLEFGIEYNTDYYTGVLLIPVFQEIANNLLSQIERTNFDIWGEEFSALAVPLVGDNP